MLKYDKISNVLSIITSAIALSDIQETIYIIVLIVSLLNILINTGVKIYNHIKNKQYDKISEELDEAKKELEELKKERDE